MLDCPRCKMMLGTEQYENQEVNFCGNCWGHWVNLETFEKILRSEVYEFSKSESDSLLKKWSAQATVDIDKSKDIQCPECHRAMRQMPFADNCPVIVDRCKTHGVWLDASEIKEIQIFIDSLRSSE